MPKMSKLEILNINWLDMELNFNDSHSAYETFNKNNKYLIKNDKIKEIKWFLIPKLNLN